jgi:hypothetical protein
MLQILRFRFPARPRIAESGDERRWPAPPGSSTLAVGVTERVAALNSTVAAKAGPFGGALPA